MVCSEENTYNFKTGTICSIDIYGNIKVKLEENNIFAIFKREELKLLFKKYNSTYYMDRNPAFIHYLQKNYAMKPNSFHRIMHMELLKQLIDVALDTRDRTWFLELARQYKEISRIRDE